jgi:hypothetical protein
MAEIEAVLARQKQDPKITNTSSAIKKFDGGRRGLKLTGKNGFNFRHILVPKA